jgi:arginine/lysine/ornithine decarboxylase
MKLYDKLTDYSNKSYYPMHMPGHKRNTSIVKMMNPYMIDITEIEGFDNLHHMEGILKESTGQAAKLYTSHYTNYLVGGSTAGILAGIAACTNKGDKILVARNSHKSVYNAIYLNELQPVYIYPQQEDTFEINGGISPKEIETLLIKHRDTKAIVITSPTYEGIVSDIRTIAGISHKYGIPLIVDEAHGAHFGFHPYWPQSSVKLGADVVIHSLHKTLPALTQTGLIHVNGSLVDKDEVTRYLGIYQSSSPSYVFMSSIGQCIGLLEEKREVLFPEFKDKLEVFYKNMKQLKKLQLLDLPYVKNMGSYDIDPSKITVLTNGSSINGNELYYRLLEKYKIQMEMVSGNYVLGITSICDTQEGFLRFSDALLEIDSEIQYNKSTGTLKGEVHKSLCEYTSRSIWKQPDLVMSAYKAYEVSKETLPITNCAGRTTAEYIYLYPPGIPLLVPGERIQENMIAEIQKMKERGLSIQGMKDKSCEYIKVVKE